MSEAQGFDLRTEIRDPKTGKLISYQPYRLMVSPEGEFFERPPGSGKLYDRSGTLIRDREAEQAEAARKKAEADKVAAEAKAKADAEALAQAEAKAEAEKLAAEAQANAAKVVEGARQAGQKASK